MDRSSAAPPGRDTVGPGQVPARQGTGSQFEVDISFAALHQLLHPCFAELPHLTPLHAQALNVALGLGEGPPPAQLLVASAVLALLQQVAKKQPLLLIVDDLPWLDRASALVLGMVARRLAGLPVALRRVPDR